MNRMTLIAFFSIAAVSIIHSPLLAAPQPAGARRAGSAARAQADGEVQLPAAISDPLLLAAWLRIYQQQALIQPSGAAAVSGRRLAQFARQQAIPVVWDTAQVCKGGSCSVLHCGGERCTYDDGRPGVDPIYIAPSERADLQALTRTLAHEIFHRMQPFGPVRTTRYEEYWAFRVGTDVAQASWPRFDGFDPLDPLFLTLWIQVNRLGYYLQLPEYPAAVAAQVVRTAGGGDPYSGVPTQAYGAP